MFRVNKSSFWVGEDTIELIVLMKNSIWRIRPQKFNTKRRGTAYCKELQTMCATFSDRTHLTLLSKNPWGMGHSMCYSWMINTCFLNMHFNKYVQCIFSIFFNKYIHKKILIRMFVFVWQIECSMACLTKCVRNFSFCSHTGCCMFPREKLFFMYLILSL